MTEKTSTPDPTSTSPASPAPDEAPKPKASDAGGEPKPKASTESGEKREPSRIRMIKQRQARWGLRLLLLALVALIVLLLLWWKHCLPGQGSGGSQSAQESSQKSTKEGQTAGVPADAKGTSCALRVDAEGITVEGKPAPSPEAAVTACGAAKRAVLTVTGDAISGTVDKLEEALRGADIAVQRQR